MHIQIPILFCLGVTGRRGGKPRRERRRTGIHRKEVKKRR